MGAQEQDLARQIFLLQLLLLPNKNASSLHIPGMASCQAGTLAVLSSIQNAAAQARFKSQRTNTDGSNGDCCSHERTRLPDFCRSLEVQQRRSPLHKPIQGEGWNGGV